MSHSDSIQTISNNVKKKLTAADFVAPYNHLPVPNALEFAKTDYFNHRTYGVAQLAYKKGATQVEVAKAINVDPAIVTRQFPKKGETK